MIRPKLPRRLRRTLGHDWPAIVLVLLNLAAIGYYLDIGPARSGAGGYRVIDTAAVTRLMEKGDLSTHEARWYHPTTSREGVNQSEFRGSR